MSALFARAVALAVVAATVTLAQSTVATIFDPNQCGVPAVVGSSILHADLVSIQVGNCVTVSDADPTTWLRVTLLDRRLSQYAIGGAVSITYQIDWTPTFMEADWMTAATLLRTIRYRAAVGNATNNTDVTTTAEFANAVVDQDVVFSNVRSLAEAGVYRLRITTSVQARFVPQEIIGLVLSNSDPSCYTINTRLPALSVIPPSGSVLPVNESLRSFVVFLSRQHELYTNAMPCVVIMDGITYYPTNDTAVKTFRLQARVGAVTAQRLRMRCSFGGLSPKLSAQAAGIDAVETPALTVTYTTESKAPPPRFETSKKAEQYQVMDSKEKFFDPFYVRIVAAMPSTVPSKTLYVIVPGDTRLLQTPPLALWNEFFDMPGEKIEHFGLYFTGTAQLLAYTVAAGYTSSDISILQVRIPSGTATWKYVLLGLLLGACVIVAIGVHIRQIITDRRRADAAKPKVKLQVAPGVASRSHSRSGSPFKSSKRDASRSQAAAGAADQEKSTNASSGTGSVDRDEAAKNDEAQQRIRKKALRGAGFIAFVLSDLALVVLDLTFAITCFAYSGVGTGYKLLYPATMVGFLAICLLRWHWATKRFDDNSDDDDEDKKDDEDEEDEFKPKIGLSLQFAPLANVVTLPYFIRHPDTLLATEKPREFWAGVVRICVDVPQLIIVVVFIVRNPTRTNDASLLKLFFTLTCLVFGWRGAWKAGKLGAIAIFVLVRRFIRRDDDSESDSDDGRRKKSKIDEDSDEERRDRRKQREDEKTARRKQRAAEKEAEALRQQQTGDAAVAIVTTDPFGGRSTPLAGGTSGGGGGPRSPYRTATADELSYGDDLTESQKLHDDIETLVRLRVLRELNELHHQQLNGSRAGSTDPGGDSHPLRLSPSALQPSAATPTTSGSQRGSSPAMRQPSPLQSGGRGPYGDPGSSRDSLRPPEIVHQRSATAPGVSTQPPSALSSPIKVIRRTPLGQTPRVHFPDASEASQNGGSQSGLRMPTPPLAAAPPAVTVPVRSPPSVGGPAIVVAPKQLVPASSAPAPQPAPLPPAASGVASRAKRSFALDSSDDDAATAHTVDYYSQPPQQRAPTPVARQPTPVSNTPFDI
jgi:hypothetical protein